jgi:hypothetical protein
VVNENGNVTNKERYGKICINLSVSTDIKFKIYINNEKKRYKINMKKKHKKNKKTIYYNR